VTAVAGMAWGLGGRTGGVVVYGYLPAADLVGSRLSDAGVTGRTMLVIATQGHRDEEALEEALQTDAAYVGLVASHSRAERVRAYLRDRGVAAEALDRIRAPAGLDLGPTGHEEIAVSVLAELVQLRASGALPRGAATTKPAPEVRDPVCGMVVPADAPHSAVHEGVTYRFCCPGCRAAFEADPAAYTKATA
jgi:xanthine dehydrogenase accessory factor